MANILVVDDSYLTHRLIELILRSERHAIAAARNGVEAVAYLEKNRVDLLISDINMPYLDGLGLLDKVRADKRFKDLPVILITASGQERIHREVQMRGACGFLTHPFSSSELKKLVSSCLDQDEKSSSDIPRNGSCVENL